ncbi:hypothetical protein ACFRQM_09620 [Streptomyces sp. NPDC056831]|uniref:hypothetical protein n=1 Tax=Streptomyces sp. NPDC056831 TaxID=3345954 RepID=UPI0036835300
MTETFGPEYVRPAQDDCPNCPCCTAALCAKGRTTILECYGLTRDDVRDNVRGCPCSSEETRGTASWRHGKLRATTLALSERRLTVDGELALRAVAAGEIVAEYAEEITSLSLRRFVGFVDNRPALTELGATYLAAQVERRFSTPVEVEAVDVRTRTARVIVVGWNLTEPVTVLLDQLIGATDLQAEELPGRFLEADANCYAPTADDVVLTNVRLAPPLPAAWMAGDVPVVEDKPVALVDRGATDA